MDGRISQKIWVTSIKQKKKVSILKKCQDNVRGSYLINIEVESMVHKCMHSTVEEKIMNSHKYIINIYTYVYL